ncbi:MAG: cupin domain-containing protein [Patescibacteria group bacterium]
MKIIKKIKPFFIDERGEMSYLLDNANNITSVLYITCKKGAVRANHYHKKDTHYSYMVNGSMEYTYQDVKAKNAKKHKIIVKKGEIVESPPMTIHAMRFLEDSSFIALTTESRDRKKYEKDTVRVKLV